MKIRSLFLCIIFIVLCLPLNGCKKTIVNSNVVKQVELEGSINILNAGIPQNILDYDINTFVSKNAKVKINVNTTDNLKKFFEDNKANVENIPDIIFTNEENQVSIRKYVEDFIDFNKENSSMKDKINKNFINQVTYNNKIYAIPWNGSSVCMLYNINEFNKNSIKADDITTWEQYIIAGKKISEGSSGAVKLLPMNVNTADLYRLLTNELGLSYVDKNGSLNLKVQDSIRTINLIKSLYASNLIYNISDKDNVQDIMNSNKFATVLMDSSSVKEYINHNSSEQNKWGIMNIPAFEPGGKNAIANKNNFIAVSSKSKNKNLALEFAKFCNTDTSAIEYSMINNGWFSEYVPFEDDIILDKKEDYFNGQKIWRFLYMNLGNATEKTCSEFDQDIRNEIIKAQQSILINNESIDNTMNKAEDNLRINLMGAVY
jgi:ABC-type sugar transport system, periplasmic component